MIGMMIQLMAVTRRQRELLMTGRRKGLHMWKKKTGKMTAPMPPARKMIKKTSRRKLKKFKMTKNLSR